MKGKVFRVLKFRLPKHDKNATALKLGVMRNLGWKDDVIDSDAARECWNNLHQVIITQLRTKRGTVVAAFKLGMIGE